MLTHLARNLESLVMTALPHGGQRSARRNAWASMSADATRARQRREATLYLDRAIAMRQHPAARAR